MHILLKFKTLSFLWFLPLILIIQSCTKTEETSQDAKIKPVVIGYAGGFHGLPGNPEYRKMYTVPGEQWWHDIPSSYMYS